MKDDNKYLIFAGSSNLKLASDVVAHLGKKLGKCNLGVFSDGEIRFQSWENVRGADVFVVQSLTEEINFHIMELLLMADAFKRASARRITAVIPYYAYARQDRKDRPRVPISSRLLADLLETAGFSRILTIEGGVERARMFSKQIHAGLAIGDKRREKANVAEIMHIIGDVKGKNVIIVDDIIDTAGTLYETIKALKKNGAKSIYALCTHGIFSGRAIEKIENSPVEKIFVSDTIPLKNDKLKSNKIEVLSVSKLFAEAIDSIHEETSVSKLFL